MRTYYFQNDRHGFNLTERFKILKSKLYALELFANNYVYFRSIILKK